MLRKHAKISILILTTLIIVACLATLKPSHAKYATDSIGEEAYADWYTVNNTYANDVVTGDLDNDGTVEIVEGVTYHTGKPWPPVPSYDYRYGQIRIFNHDGTALQTEYVYNWTIAETAYRDFYALCIADIDNDGTKEIITGSCIWEQVGAGEYEGELAVWNWTGTTLNQEKYTKWYSPHQNLVYDVWAGDVDGDNQTDIVTTGTYYNETSTYVCSELKIWNVTGIVYPNPKPECTQQWWTNELVYSRSVTAADVDNDTQTEIITAGFRRTQTNYYISQLKIWNWNGTILTLEKTEEWGAFTNGDSCIVYQVYVADLEDDDYPEIIAVGYRNLTTAIAQVRIWNWNTTILILRQAKEWTGPLAATVGGAYVEDVDSDGLPEIITFGTESTNATFAQAQLRTWEWNGTAMNLKEEAKWGNYTTGVRVAADDVDNDHIREMICIGSTNKTCWNAYLAIQSIPDLVNPEIHNVSQDPPSPVPQGTPVKVSAEIYDYGTDIKNATLHYTIDDGAHWLPIEMDYNATSENYEATIPGNITQGTTVKYKITAYDNAENPYTEDNAGAYYVFSVVPEYTTPLLLVFMLATLVAILLIKTRRRP